MKDTKDTIVEEFKTLDTTCVSDAMDRLGITCGLSGIKPLSPGLFMCGRAFTVHYSPCGEKKGTVGDYLDSVEPGGVVVIDNGGRTDCTVWGDLMTICAVQNKIAGTLIDGVCRDITVIREKKYPIFSRGYYMVTGKDRVFVDNTGVPVSVSNVQVCPDDIILGDDSGVIVIPGGRAEEVLKVAREIDEKENVILKLLNDGVSLKDAREKVKYHDLQTKKK